MRPPLTEVGDSRAKRPRTETTIKGTWPQRSATLRRRRRSVAIRRGLVAARGVPSAGVQSRSGTAARPETSPPLSSAPSGTAGMRRRGAARHGVGEPQRVETAFADARTRRSSPTDAPSKRGAGPRHAGLRLRRRIPAVRGARRQCDADRGRAHVDVVRRPGPRPATAANPDRAGPFPPRQREAETNPGVSTLTPPPSSRHRAPLAHGLGGRSSSR